MHNPFTVPLRAEVASLPRYIPGRSIVGADKISSNEMPYPPSVHVIDAAIAALASPNRYPDMAATDLTAALAEHHKVGVEHICVGTGSSAVLLAALSAVCIPNAEVIFPWRSFESYPIAVPASGGKAVPVPLTETGEHDIEAMIAAVTPHTVALIVCTPNNPTGPALSCSEVENIVRHVPAHVLVIVDEAYIDFATDPQVRTAIPLIEQYPNVLVMRTFSKAYALAGLRVGYAVAHADLIAAMRALSVPFGVSAVAQAAARAALEHQQDMRERVDEVVAERERIVTTLRGLGVPVPDTQANFYWLPGCDVSFVEACERAGLVVRPFPEGVRVTVGTREQNNRLLAVASEYFA
ncbi:histidinol-phosphate transaminase [Schaalia sp. lx-100]|uniref:histidinol-phosphate transaminase n=1 Tax=Schaalia sp. lx-100 TaxID=2899081 RepID=UPI001E2DF5E8|nr:histidinol-phosphate transaminase [Schaalia sp. lx-100]MCD4557791.1 histidinol-phosphate transaminase [Schaalia sp. lx-100]